MSLPVHNHLAAQRIGRSGTRNQSAVTIGYGDRGELATVISFDIIEDMLERAYAHELANDQSAWAG